MKKIYFILCFNSALSILYQPDSLNRPPSLKNLGNTCYMNATIQALYNIPALNELLIKNQTAFETDKESLAYHYLQLIDALNAKKINSPYNIDRTLQNFATKTDEEIQKRDDVGSCAQHDSDEYLLMLFGNLEKYGKQKIQSGIQEIFTIELLSETTCPSPEIISKRSENTLRLEPPVVNPQGKLLISLQTCLTEYFKKETNIELTTQTNCTKQYFIEKAHDIFIIQLKKYRRTLGGGIHKVENPIFIPFQLNLAPFFKQPKTEPINYRLISAIQQRGGTGGGHYVSYIREYESGKWFYCNDARIVEISLPELMKQLDTSYLFFYEKGIATKQELDLQKQASQPTPTQPLTQELEKLTQALNQLTQELKKN